MPLAIIISDAQSRHSILLMLNITGVVACLCTKVLLLLTALNVIFKEPDVTPVMQDHLANNSKFIIHMRASDAPFPPIEDAYLYYLNMLMFSEDAEGTTTDMKSSG